MALLGLEGALKHYYYYYVAETQTDLPMSTNAQGRGPLLLSIVLIDLIIRV